jgi:hypothetical protein
MTDYLTRLPVVIQYRYGSVAYTSEQGRSNSNNDVLMASLIYRF